MTITGGMQEGSLRVSNLIDHAGNNHGAREIVTRWADGRIERSNWAAVAQSARKLAQWLPSVGVAKGDRVATLAMNHGPHLSSWFGVAGMGGVLHTVNPRLFEEQLVYIFNHAADRVLLFDRIFLPLVDKLKPSLTTIEHYVLFDGESGDFYPSLASLTADLDGRFDWVDGAETDPCGLCYTSGTTGNPKGVLYTHRSNVLHTLLTAQADALGAGNRSAIMPIVPMFHANAWGLPFLAAMIGAKMVFSTVNDPGVLWDLLRSEGVSHAAGVPTVWLTMFQHLDAHGGDMGKLERILVGGSAVPRATVERFVAAGVQVSHAWGMTETSPVATISSPTPDWDERDDAARIDYLTTQGRTPFLIDLKITDDAGNVLPRDGKVSGDLHVRGPWVAQRYFGADADAADADGWFATGDVATIDAEGVVRITDRSKDVIKSGGEWISSIDLENATIGCPGVAEAAAVGIRHPKWEERPLLLIVRKQGADVTADDVLDWLRDRVARWWLPDVVEFVDELPHTATGKLSKLTIRAQYRDYQLPVESEPGEVGA